MDWDYQLDPNDDLVADLLSQFKYHAAKDSARAPEDQPEQPTESHAQPENSHEVQPDNPQPTYSQVQPANQLQETLQLSLTSEESQPSGLKLAAVEVPAVVNGEEYEYLPGHSAVRYVIREEQDAEGDVLYKVRMWSSELQTVRTRLLLALDGQATKAPVT